MPRDDAEQDVLGLYAEVVSPPGSARTLADATVALRALVPDTHPLLNRLSALQESGHDAFGSWAGYDRSTGGPAVGVQLQLSFPNQKFTLVLRCDLTAARVEHVEALSHAARLLLLIQPMDSRGVPVGEVLNVAVGAPPDPRGHLRKARRLRKA